MKKKNLSVIFGIRIGIEIIILITILGFATIFVMRQKMEKTFVTSTTELLQAHVQGLAYRNSKFMQQLRTYTLCDAVNAGGSTEKSAVQTLQTLCTATMKQVLDIPMTEQLQMFQIWNSSST